MPDFREYDDYDATGLADLVRRREVSPTELVDAAILRIERRNPTLNAVVGERFEKARAEAKGTLPDGPFRGVPIVLKDLLAAYAGEPLTSGSRFYGDYTSARNSELVNRLLAAGFIVVARTNTPEFGLVPTTEPERYGPTLNPWDRSRSPGGSSGGSGVAVAARMVPIGMGGDGGGSLRIPASCCGVFGLKPTRGRNPTGPGEGEGWEGFAQEHGITRSVRDSAALLDATQGEDVGAPYAAPKRARPFAEEVGAPPGRLRILVTVEPPLARNVHADCRNAVDDAVRLLGELGHEIVHAAPSLDGGEFARAMVTMLAGQTAAEIRDAERRVGRRATFRDVESSTWVMRVLGESFSAGEYQHAVRTLQRLARSLSEFIAPYDAWLTPTLGAPPPTLGTLGPRGITKTAQRIVGRFQLGGLVRASGMIDRVASEFFEFIPYTPLANATGEPSMSVPLHWSERGLPIGVQLTARFGDEATLFRLAAQLETARPWKARIPPGIQ